MSRGLSAPMLSAIAAGTLYPIMFGYFDFAGSALRACTAGRAVTWDGQTWVGLGTFVGVEPVQESRAVRANGVAFTLNGIPSSLITEVLTLRSRGRFCKLWLGFFNSSGALLADPVMLFSGRMDQPMINDSGEKADIVISAESRLVDMQRTRERRLTDADQQNLYPGDVGLSFVVGLQDKDLVWGKATTPGSLGGGASGASSSGSGGVDRGTFIQNLR